MPPEMLQGRANYKNEGKMTTGDCLLIVDVQKGFVTPDTAHVPAAAASLQRNYRTAFATRFLNPQGSMHRRLIHWSRFAPGTAETELAFSPGPRTTVIDKTMYTCVTREFVDTLRKMRATRVDICGIATDGCVLKCAVDLFEAGIVPVVLAGACGSHGGPSCHEAGLMLLRRFIGRDQVVQLDPGSRPR